jgi:hypothetical protein
MQAVEACAAEYQQFYVPELEARRKEREQLEIKRQKVGGIGIGVAGHMLVGIWIS